MFHILDFMASGVAQATWYIAIVFFMVVAMSVVYRNASPSFKYLLWSLVIFRVLLPFRFSPMDLIPKSESMPLPEMSTVIARVQTIGDIIPAGITATPMDFTQLLQIVWLSGFSLYLLAVISWVFYSKRHLRRCEEITNPALLELVEKLRQRLAIRQPIQSFYLHDAIESSPTIAGVMRFRLYMPRAIVDEWDMQDVEPIIIHELVHAKRHDVFFNWIQIFVQAVFFFNPMIWYANSKIRYFREEVCDDITVNFIENKRKRYSVSILNVLELVSDNQRVELSSIYFSERKSSLARRIMRLANKQYRYYQPLNKISFASLFIIGAMAFTLSCETIPDNILGDSGGGIGLSG